MGNHFRNFVFGVECVMIEAISSILAEMETTLTGDDRAFHFVGLPHLILKIAARPIRIEHLIAFHAHFLEPLFLLVNVCKPFSFLLMVPDF